MPKFQSCRIILFTYMILVSAISSSEEVTVAVATNFAVPLQSLATDFESQSKHQLVQISGSTGNLYAQIINGAPFDILLAADAQRPELLAKAGLGSTPFTYAIGQLVFWSAREMLFTSGIQPDFRELAIRTVARANPRLAPYGLAAQQAINHLELEQRTDVTVVTGANIGQAYAMTASGNADAGFLALSQLVSLQNQKPAGSYWLVNPDLYAPIIQQAIVLNHGAGKPAVAEFARYLQSARAQGLIQQYGYLTD